MTTVTTLTYGDVPLLGEDGRFPDEFTPQQVLDIEAELLQIEINIDAHLAAMLAKSMNLSDVPSPSAARVNLGAAPAVHQHQISEVAGLSGALAVKADLVNGVVPTSQIPSKALITAVPVASEAAMLALTSEMVQPGDIAIRAQDGAGTFMLINPDPSKIGSWVLLAVPTDKVTSVNGQTSTVVLGAADVGAATPAQVQAAFNAVQLLADGYAQQAAGSAQASQQSANQASSYAVSAGQQAVLSESSKTDSVAAKVISVQAKDDAVAAKVIAVQAKDDAVSAKNSADGSAGTASGAATIAGQAKDDAVTAKNAAVQAKDDAVSAKSDSVTAKNASVQAKDDAVVAKNAAAQSAIDAASAKTDAVAAKNMTEQAVLTGLTWSGAVDLSSVTGPTLYRATVTGNITGFTLPTPASSRAFVVTLVLIQDATGSRTASFAGILWPFGVAPVLTTTANAKDIINVQWTGVAWVGYVGGMNVS